VRPRARRPARGSLEGEGKEGHGWRNVRTLGCVHRQGKLRWLTGAACDDALPPLLLREAGHKIVRATDLEAEDLLQVLAL